MRLTTDTDLDGGGRVESSVSSSDSEGSDHDAAAAEEIAAGDDSRTDDTEDGSSGDESSGDEELAEDESSGDEELAEAGRCRAKKQQDVKQDRLQATAVEPEEVADGQMEDASDKGERDETEDDGDGKSTVEKEQGLKAAASHHPGSRKPCDDVDGGDGGGDGGGAALRRSGWADAMAKVLESYGSETAAAAAAAAPMTSDGRNIILSKALLDRNNKKISNAKATTAVGPKPADGGGGASSSNSLVAGRSDGGGSARARLKRKRELESTARTKPDHVTGRAREKQLAKIATKGVVQLFNAVREQQRGLQAKLKQAGPSLRKRDNVYKDISKEGFLEVLSGGGGGGGGGGKTAQASATAATDKPKKMKHEPKEEVKHEEQSQETWNIIRDDFMMGVKMKDWDKESDSDG